MFGWSPCRHVDGKDLPICSYVPNWRAHGDIPSPAKVTRDEAGNEQNVGEHERNEL